MIEYMFEESETAARSLVDRICGSSRDENRAAVQKLVSVGDLYLLRQREFGDCAAWSTDPIDWRHNDDGDLEVTITLPRLRPLAEWRGDEYGEDIVLIVDPGANIESIKVIYTATAHGYGDVFESEPITVPVEKVAMLDVLRKVMEAKKAS